MIGSNYLQPIHSAWMNPGPQPDVILGHDGHLAFLYRTASRAFSIKLQPQLELLRHICNHQHPVCTTLIMPTLPSEEQTESGIFDKVAKQSSDSTASSHQAHNKEKASAMDHRSKGPQISDSTWSAF